MIESEFDKWIKEQSYKIRYNKAICKTAEYQLEEVKIEEIPIKKDQAKDIEIEISHDDVIEAPVRKDQVIGNIKVILKDEILLQANIQLKEDINKKQVWDYLKELCLNYINYLREEIEVAM